MTHFDRHQKQRELRLQLEREFPDFELVKWYTQYREIKAAHPDTVLLYRLGEFYEAFDDDAKLVAELLDVTLTHKHFANHKRTKAQQRTPMAGMPYHSIERYVAAIVGAGYRVAIAEQTSETPSSKSDTRSKSVFAAGIEQRAPRKDMVDREVVRVITPGTVIEPGMLSAVQNNYLTALIADGGRVGLAYADLSTGEFCCTEFSGERAGTQAQGELARLQAVEVLVPDDPALRLPGLDPASARLEHDLAFMTKDERELLLPGERVARRIEGENNARWAHGHLTSWPAWRWKLQTAADTLMQQLHVRSLDGFGLRDKPLAARAAGAVIQYIHETQRSAADQINTLHTYSGGGTMFLDPQTRRNLELLESSRGTAKASLVAVLDQTRTPMGGRLLRRWVSQPLLDIARLQARQDGVAHFADDALLRATVREKLKQVGDLERAVNRVVQGITVATPRDMVRLREGLRALPELAEALAGWMPPQADERRTTNDDRPNDEATHHDEQPPSSDDWWDEEGDNGQQSDPILQPPAPSPQPQAPSLREQRESKRRLAARHDEDDLFGEDEWDDEPATDDGRSTTDNRPANNGYNSGDLELGRTQSKTPPVSSLQSPVSSLDPCGDVLAFLEQSLDDDPPALLGASNYLRSEEGGEPPRRTIRPGFEPTMDAIVEATREAKRWIEQLEPKERARLGIKNDKGLRVDYNKVFGYYIEVSNSYADRIPTDYIRKQTVATGERYFTAELKEYETVVLGAQEKLVELEQKAFAKICAAVAAEGQRLLASARALAEIDVYAALAEAAVRGRYTRPSLHDDTRLRITGGRHPVVERMLDEPFIPNDATLDTGGDQILLVTGPNMAGKCLVGNTLIFTDRGLMPIADLMPDDAHEGEFTAMTCQVHGISGRQEATHFYRGGRQATIRLTTRLGYQIEGTPEHRVWVRRLDGSEGWKLLGDIVQGDVVAIERQIDLWGHDTTIDHSAAAPLKRAKQHQLPSELDEDLAYLIGLLIGDGTLTYVRDFALSTADTFIADEFRRIVDRLFGYQVGSKANGKDHYVSSRQIREFLARLGLGYGQAHEKFVPQSILKAPKHIVVAFLQGLFDTDGSANNRYGGVQLSTSSIRLAREVQLLLLNLGLISSLRGRQTLRRTNYLISIYGADALTFHEKVGFRLPRKRERQILSSSIIRMPNIGGIPHRGDTLKQVQAQIVTTADKPVALKHNKRINSIFYTYIPNGRNISYTKLDELVTYCRQSNVACPELETLQAKRYFYDPIRTIEQGEADVYDLSVAIDHAYIANGFISHNSTCLRQIALIVLMAQIGSFVPADAAEIGIVDRIFTRIGAQDDIATGQSTFMVEMTETAALLIQSTKRSLIILDEVGRGTSTYDGMAIARAVVEYIHNEPRLGCRTLFATHYHELTDLEQTLPRVKNYHMAAVEQDQSVVFLHELRRGGADRSYGIHVAQLAGIPRSVIRRAGELLAELEQTREPGTKNQEPPRGYPPIGPTKNRAGIDNGQPTMNNGQLSLFDVAPSPLIEMLRRLNVNELTPIEALTKLYELQKLAKQ